MSAGSGNPFAIITDGAVWSWGFGNFGQLGHSISEVNQLLPKKIEAITADGALLAAWS